VKYAAAILLACSPVVVVAKEPPRLIVQITLDQLRADALEHYEPALSGGLKRILDDGYWATNAVVDHAITVSHPGHATLATGAHPSRHGLTANEWWMERDERWTWVEAIADPDEKIAGTEEGGPSARHLLSPTLGEWVKAANPQAKAVSLSTGNTVALDYGGHVSDGVYWFDSSSGGFVTSTYYRDAVADWVSAFNDSDLPAFKKEEWLPILEAEALKLADPDASPIENEGKHAVFPHRFEIERKQEGADDRTLDQWFAGTPMKDEALVDFAKRAIAAEKLGADGVTDYLSVAFDSTDTIGHRFGWKSVEYLDALVRIDRGLGEFLDYLGAEVGKGNYVLALSADHGVADFPETTGKHRVTNAEIEAALDRVEALAANYKGDAVDLPELIAKELEKSDFIAEAYTQDDLKRVPGDPYAYLYRRSFRPDVTPDFPLWTEKESRPHHPARYGVVVRYSEGAIFDSAPAVHGSPYDYDRRVPVVFYGAGVKARRSDDKVATVDVAPTLAELAGITPPANIDGISRAATVLGKRQ
jgi:predicted AlkP superfamily pyrophosphatase or phosphodiesterase